MTNADQQPDGTPPEASADDERLTALRAQLESVGSVPVDERVELFERANAIIAQELAELDEV